MKNVASAAKKQHIKDLKVQVTKLRTELTKVVLNESLKIRLQKSQARFVRIRNPHGRDAGVGTFLLLVDITATQNDVYIPLSIASGKKPTGFVYQIEGTGDGTISSTEISYSGAGVTQITLGTIVYTKILKGKTATFRILVEMGGLANEEYSIVINRMNYKRAPSDARYASYLQEIRSKALKFQ